MSEDRIHWHPVFATALKLELMEYYPALEIIEEYQLTSKPLEIDILVVKKLKEVKILKNIAKIFKGHNIIEYKSPTDYICIDDFYKVKAYTYMYKTLGRKVDEIKIEDMTITIVSNSFPNKIAEYLKEKQKIRVEKQNEGVYYLRGK